MRPDPLHSAKIRAAILPGADGRPVAHFDIAFMLSAFGRLTLWERGILTDSLLRASQAKRPTIEQRALLALFLAPIQSLTDVDEVRHE